MDAELGRRQREDQPAVAVVDVAPAEDVAQNRAQLVGLRRVQQDMRAGDPDRRILRPVRATMCPCPAGE
jgi:hypothetical protein